MGSKAGSRGEADSLMGEFASQLSSSEQLVRSLVQLEG